MPFYRHTYDANGNPTGTVEYTFRRSPRNRIGCLGWMCIVFFGPLFFLWPVAIMQHFLALGIVVGVLWWGGWLALPIGAGVSGYRKGKAMRSSKPPPPPVPRPKPTHTPIGTPLGDLRASNLNVPQARYSDRR